jgi:tetratricopeptide (TPR) repeat protein
MNLRRQFFRPGRRLEQIGKLGAHPFFVRSRDGRSSLPAAPPSPMFPAAARRGLLPRLAENAGALFSIVVSVLLVAALVALSFAFLRDLRRDAFELDAFTAPKDVADRGYTSTAIAEAILDEIRTVQTEAFTLQARRQLEVAAALPDVQVAGSGLSMKAIVRYARRLFDLPDNRISGDLLQDGRTLKLALRVREGAGTRLVVVNRDDGDVDRLLRGAGRALVQIADPHLLVTYLFAQEVKAKNFVETRAAIDYLLAQGSPDDRANGYRALGRVQEQEGHPEDALASYRRSAELDPAGGPNRVVTQLVRMGRDDEAEALVRPRAESAATVDDLLMVASAMRTFGRFADELDYAKRALALDPDGIDTQNEVGTALRALHRPREALSVVARALKQNPNDRDLPSSVGINLAAMGRAAEALEVCNAALATWPGDLWCRQIRGDAYASLGRLDDAFAEYRYAQDRGNSSPNLATRFGDALLAAGRPQEALAQYALALKEEPHHWMAHTGSARAHLALGNAKLAADRFAATARNDPDDPLLYREWARALVLLGKSNEAAGKLAEADQADARLRIPLPLR